MAISPNITSWAWSCLSILWRCAAELERMQSYVAGVPERVLSDVLHEARGWFGLPVCTLLRPHSQRICTFFRFHACNTTRGP